MLRFRLQPIPCKIVILECSVGKGAPWETVLVANPDQWLGQTAKYLQSFNLFQPNDLDIAGFCPATVSLWPIFIATKPTVGHDKRYISRGILPKLAFKSDFEFKGG